MSSNAPSPAPSRKPKPVPERFQVAKTTLWFDRIMTKTIIGGGFTVIVAVFGILFFLLSAANFTGSQTLHAIAGYEGILCGGFALYEAAAIVINEKHGRQILPL